MRVSYPDDVPETIRQQKINKMYDIFLGAMRRNGTEETTEWSGNLPKKNYSYDYAVAIFGRLRYDIDVKPAVRLQTQLEVNNEKIN